MIHNYTISTDTANGKADNESLKRDIEASSITIALDYITIASDALTVAFKAALSAGEITSLDSIVAAHTGDRVIDEQLIKMKYELAEGGKKKTDRGFKFTATNSTATTHDYKVTDSLQIQEGFLYTDNQEIHDSVTMSLVDKDYIMAGILYPADYGGTAWNLVYPDGVPLHTYIKDWPVNPGGETHSVNEALSEIDIKNLYVRVVYSSTGTADVKCNVGIKGYS